MNFYRARRDSLVLVALIGQAVLLGGCGSSTSPFGTVIPAPTSPPESSPTTTSYITPTPLFGLPGGDVLRATAEAAGTATRMVQLTSVPTWPVDTPRDYPTLPLSTPFSPIPRRVAGAGTIVESGLVDLPSQAGLFQNQWYEELDGQYIEVFAGTESSPVEAELMKGIIVVRISDNSNNLLSLDSYETPVAVGSVRVFDAVGERLTLRADDGTLFYFDVPTRQWVTPTPTPASLLPTP